jgi:hypothetical protein
LADEALGGELSVRKMTLERILRSNLLAQVLA